MEDKNDIEIEEAMPIFEQEESKIEEWSQQLKLDQLLIKEKGLLAMTVLTILISVLHIICFLQFDQNSNKFVHISIFASQIILLILVQSYRTKSLPKSFHDYEITQGTKKIIVLKIVYMVVIFSNLEVHY